MQHHFTDCAFGEGKAEGIAEGKAKKAIDTVKKMLEKGFDWNTISEITGLSEDEYLKPKDKA